MMESERSVRECAKRKQTERVADYRSVISSSRPHQSLIGHTTE